MFGFQLHSIYNNLWQCLEQNEIQLTCQKIPFLSVFLNEVFLIHFLIKFEKYQKVILGPSSPDSVPIFEKNLGKTFTEFF